MIKKVGTMWGYPVFKADKMIIKISNKKAKGILQMLEKGECIELENIGILTKRIRPDRVAFHNNSGKKITIKGWTTIVLIPLKK